MWNILEAFVAILEYQNKALLSKNVLFPEKKNRQMSSTTFGKDHDKPADTDVSDLNTFLPEISLI
jgi:hypothetical protein